MKTLILLTIATAALLTGTALAEQARYTCRAGALTITSTSPCYVTQQGITVPGGGGDDKENKKGQDGEPNVKKGGGLNGPKDLKDKPKGGGFNGPKDIKNKD